MAKKNRAGNKNKRSGSACWHKMMSEKAKQRREKIYLYERRKQSNLKRIKVERQNGKSNIQKRQLAGKDLQLSA